MSSLRFTRPPPSEPARMPEYQMSPPALKQLLHCKVPRRSTSVAGRRGDRVKPYLGTCMLQMLATGICEQGTVAPVDDGGLGIVDDTADRLGHPLLRTCASIRAQVSKWPLPDRGGEASRARVSPAPPNSEHKKRLWCDLVPPGSSRLTVHEPHDCHRC
jgi:hypothetical protein